VKKHLRQAVSMPLGVCGDGEARLCAIPLRSAHKENTNKVNDEEGKLQVTRGCKTEDKERDMESYCSPVFESSLLH
jgi:hypothetical protein